MRFCVICIFLCIVFRTSIASKSSEACKTFGGAPVVPVESSLTNRANLGEFPEAVAIGYLLGNKTSFNCNGVLISEKFVLTVAVCVATPKFVPKFVRLGKVKLLKIRMTINNGISNIIPRIRSNLMTPKILPLL